jgi:hypothetical protein
LGPDFTLLSFGTMFDWMPRHGDPRRVDALDGWNGEPFDLQQVGARHNSVASFCFAHPGSLGFVVSEDGPVSCLLRPAEEPALRVYRPISVDWLPEFA